MRGIGFIEKYGTGIYMIITNKIYAEINGVSNKTASLELRALVRMDLPGVEGSGRSTKYIPRI